jgi:hypothetical protein
MLQRLLNDRPNIILISVIALAILFFVFVMPKIEKYDNVENKKFKENLENVLQDVPVKIDTNKCAKSCCLRTEWPLPQELQQNDMSPEELKKYIPSNFSCNFGSKNGSGCVCYTKEDSNYLTNKGGNI